MIHTMLQNLKDHHRSYTREVQETKAEKGKMDSADLEQKEAYNKPHSNNHAGKRQFPVASGSSSKAVQSISA